MRVTLRHSAELTAAEQAAIRTLSAAVYPPEMAAAWAGRAIEWAPWEWSAVCWDENGHALAHAGALFRDGLADGKSVRIGGIGGVMTHPLERRRGFAKLVVDRALELLAEQQADFALLVCLPDVIPVYERLGWKMHPGDLLVRQHGQRVKFTFNVTMTYAISNSAPPRGTIDLLGPPW